jgi:hypothetical protein
LKEIDRQKNIAKQILSRLREGTCTQDFICNKIDPERSHDNCDFYAKNIMRSFRDKSINTKIICSYIDKINEKNSK